MYRIGTKVCSVRSSCNFVKNGRNLNLKKKFLNLKFFYYPKVSYFSVSLVYKKLRARQNEKFSFHFVSQVFNSVKIFDFLLWKFKIFFTKYIF